MGDVILDNQPGIRLGFFLVVLVGMALWEVIAPRRERQLTRLQRWPHNIGIVVINTLLVRVLFPLAAVGMAIYVESRGWGLLNGSTVPAWILVPLCVAALDLAIYLQHVMRALSPGGDRSVHAHQVRRHHCPGATGDRGVRIRSDPQRYRDVQSQQCAHPPTDRSRASLVNRHAGYAPRAPFD
jgi:hypothetical protein